MNYEYLTTSILPGVALLILSTTMRLGNVRQALTDLAKLSELKLESSPSYELFRKRAIFLCRGLRLLNVSAFVFLLSATCRLGLADLGLNLKSLLTIIDVCFCSKVSSNIIRQSKV